eukprot:scaffold15675_cov46-Prasinocladus_malaysianus.AAC.1
MSLWQLCTTLHPTKRSQRPVVPIVLSGTTQSSMGRRRFLERFRGLQHLRGYPEGLVGLLLEPEGLPEGLAVALDAPGGPQVLHRQQSEARLLGLVDVHTLCRVLPPVLKGRLIEHVFLACALNSGQLHIVVCLSDG